MNNQIMGNLLNFFAVAVVFLVILLIFFNIYSKKFKITEKNASIYGLFLDLDTKSLIAIASITINYLFLVWCSFSFTDLNVIYIAIIVLVVFVQESERRIPIQYSNQTNSSYGAKQNYIPFKLNSANVMPVIFASVIFTVPTFIANLMKSENGVVTFIKKYVTYTSPTGFVVYLVLIFAFSFFYTFIQVNPEELSKNLARNGGYIPGVRPGKETIKYIKTVLGRITLIGAIFIAVIAGLPIIVSNFLSTNLPTSVSIGGTSILIVVGVALETCRQLESSLVNRNYGRKGR